MLMLSHELKHYLVWKRTDENKPKKKKIKQHWQYTWLTTSIHDIQSNSSCFLCSGVYVYTLRVIFTAVEWKRGQSKWMNIAIVWYNTHVACVNGHNLIAHFNFIFILLPYRKYLCGKFFFSFILLLYLLRWDTLTVLKT